MKKILTLLFIAFTGMAYGQTINIGSGTATTLYGPIYIFSSTSPNTNSWNLCIYDQAELLTAGGQAGDFTGISWYKSDSSSYLTPDATFQVYIKHTTITEYTTAANFDNEVIGATLVYESMVQTIPADTGLMNFPFANNFSWNGTDNIMILTRWMRIGNATDAVHWRATITTPLTRVSHSFNIVPTVGTLYTNANRPDIQLAQNSSTSINNNIFSQNIHVYPNPAKDFLVIDNCKISSTLILKDFSGRQVAISNLSPTEKQSIKLPNLASGVYFLQLLNGQFSHVEKIIIKE